MVSKSRDLDKKLAEILTPLGFKRAKGTKCFLRLWGEDTVQLIAWYHEPRFRRQALVCQVESLYDHPSYLFQSRFQFQDSTLVHGGIDCSVEQYESEFNVIQRENPLSEEEMLDMFRQGICPDDSISEEEQLVMLQQEVLPRFDRWKTASDVFQAHIGRLYSMIFSEQSRSSTKEINTLLLLGQFDEATRCVENGINNSKIEIERGMVKIPELQDMRKRCRSEKTIAEAEELIESNAQFILTNKAEMESLSIIKRWIKEEPEQISAYLERCKEKNLRDFEAVMNNTPGENLEYWWPDKTKHPDYLKEDPKEMAKRFLACKNYYGD